MKIDSGYNQLKQDCVKWFGQCVSYSMRNDKQSKKIRQLEKEISSYREALEFCYDNEIMDIELFVCATQKKAREALDQYEKKDKSFDFGGHYDYHD